MNQPPLAKRTILQIHLSISHPTHQNPHVSNRGWRQVWNSIDEPVSRNEQHETPNDPEQEKEGVAEPQKRGIVSLLFSVSCASA